MLSKYISSDALGVVMLWFALVSSVWAFMAPSKHDDERAPDARLRFLLNAAHDPFMWVAVLLLVYSAITAVNTGVGLGYDAELKVWNLTRPTAAALPGCVAGTGFPYLAVSVLVLVLYPALVHSISSRQDVYFAITASCLVVIEAVFADASGIGVRSESAVAYGLWGLAAAASMFSAERSGRRPKEMLSALALAGCFAALSLSGRPVVICAFVAAVVLLALVFSAFMFRELGFVGVLRALLLLLVAVAIAAGLFHWRSGDWEAMMPVWVSETDPVLNRFAVEAWEASPWTGSGVGSFPIVAKMAATAEDWATLGPMPDYYANGWRALLVERGMVGVLALAAAFGTMLFSWFRYARQRGLEKFAPAVPLLPLALAAVSVSMVFDGSAMQVEAVVAFAAVAAFSVNGGQ